MASQGSGVAASVDFVFSKFISLIPLKPWPGRKSLHTTLLLWVHSVSSRANKSGLIRRGSAERRHTGRYLRGTWVFTAAPAGRSNPVPLLPPGGILLEVLWRTLHHLSHWTLFKANYSRALNSPHNILLIGQPESSQSRIYQHHSLKAKELDSGTQVHRTHLFS